MNDTKYYFIYYLREDISKPLYRITHQFTQAVISIHPLEWQQQKNEEWAKAAPTCDTCEYLKYMVITWQCLEKEEYEKFKDISEWFNPNAIK